MINTQAFISALKFASHAAATNDVRYYLKTVRFEFSIDKLILVGCDGARLATVTLPSAYNLEGNFLVGIESVKHILTMFAKDKKGELTFTLTDNKIVLANSFGVTYTPTLVQGTYPDWRRVAPAYDRPISTMPQIDPSLLADSCKAIAPLCLKIKGTPSIRTNAAGEGFAIAIRPLSTANPLHTDVVAVVQPTRI